MSPRPQGRGLEPTRGESPTNTSQQARGHRPMGHKTGEVTNLSKEIAQTVSGPKIAWLLAIVAAFAVLATLGTQWNKSEAAIITGLSLTSAPASGNVNAGSTVTYTATQPVNADATNGTLSITLPANVTLSGTPTCTEPD